jgi:hypothetical protein
MTHCVPFTVARASVHVSVHMRVSCARCRRIEVCDGACLGGKVRVWKRHKEEGNLVSGERIGAITVAHLVL